MTPKLRAAYGIGGDWQQILAGVMEFPTDMTETINGMWVKNQAIAKNKGLELSADDFARMFVDQNFAE